MPDIPLRLAFAPVPLVPEIRLWQAGPESGLWDTSGGEYRSDHPPPFWAFPWPGGQAVARYLLDHPELVRGTRVLDLGAGSGIVAIAASTAGAAEVVAADVDPDAIDAIRRNAEANGVNVETIAADVLDGDVRVDLVVAGDVFYTGAMAGRVMRFLRRAQRGGARVLVGDPDRAYLPKDRFVAVAGYAVPVRAAVEDAIIKDTTVWELLAATRQIRATR